jgi:hypothetical protein
MNSRRNRMKLSNSVSKNHHLLLMGCYNSDFIIVDLCLHYGYDHISREILLPGKAFVRVSPVAL